MRRGEIWLVSLDPASGRLDEVLAKIAPIFE
jgi:mRNA-degrading endonuclease toxin of MazEF toxin-antitoxin module